MGTGSNNIFFFEKKLSPVVENPVNICVLLHIFVHKCIFLELMFGIGEGHLVSISVTISLLHPFMLHIEAHSR